MMKNTNIGASLKNMRDYFGFTQQEIADHINIRRSLYSNYESNTCVIPLKNLIKIANFYQTTVDSLLGLTDFEKITYEISFNPEKISQNIISIRKELNLSQRKLADTLNIGKTTLTDYENQKYIASTAFIYDLSRLSNISIDWILGRKDRKYLKVNKNSN